MGLENRYVLLEHSSFTGYHIYCKISSKETTKMVVFDRYTEILGTHCRSIDYSNNKLGAYNTWNRFEVKELIKQLKESMSPKEKQNTQIDSISCLAIKRIIHSERSLRGLRRLRNEKPHKVKSLSKQEKLRQLKR